MNGFPFTSSEEAFSLLPNIDGGAVFAVSPDGSIAAGHDGELAAFWSLANGGTEGFFPLAGGGIQDGFALSVLDGGAASGYDSSGVGWVFSQFFGYAQTTCSFLAATGSGTPSECEEDGIGPTVLSQYLDPISGLLVVSLAGQGSVIDVTGIDPRFFMVSGWQNGHPDTEEIPEPSTYALMAAGLLTIAAAKRRWSTG